MGVKVEITQKKDMVEALKSTLGIVSTAVDMVGISRRTHYNWLERDEDYRKEVEDIQNEGLDFAESMLFKRMRDGDTTSIIFYLKCRGKDRGYIDRVVVKDDRKKSIKEKNDTKMTPLRGGYKAKEG